MNMASNNTTAFIFATFAAGIALGGAAAMLFALFAFVAWLT